MTQDLLVQRDEQGIVTLTLNRVSRHNALGCDLVRMLRETLASIREDRSARVVILTGAGERSFCAGADLKERAQMPPEEVGPFVSSLRTMMDEVASLPQPVIAGINGFALGGGCELALACDLRVMAEGATIGLPETHLGIIPGAGGTQRLPRLLGPALAKELIFTGRRIKPEEAERLGLVNRVAAAGSLMEVCRELAAPILTAAPIALEQAKIAVDRGLDRSLEEGLKLEQSCYDVTIPTEDRTEALVAFREKRKPVFKGR